MRTFGSLVSFGRFLGELAVAAEPTMAASVAAVTANLHREVKEIIGKPNRLLPPLASSTLEQRAQETGYYRNPKVGDANAASTLLWTGGLRESYEKETFGLVGAVGSADDVAYYQEVGTARIPPRMPLRRAAQESEPENIAIFGAAVGRSLGLKP